MSKLKLGSKMNKLLQGEVLLKIALMFLILGTMGLSTWVYVKNNKQEADTNRLTLSEEPQQTVWQEKEPMFSTVFKNGFSYLRDKFEEIFYGETIEEQEEGQKAEMPENLPVIDISGWNVYKNQNYGFEIKYPKDYLRPQYVRPTKKGSKSIGSYLFQKKDLKSQRSFTGFRVAIYDKNKVLGTKDIDEITAKVLTEEDVKKDCSKFMGVTEKTIGEENYKAQEINIPKDNPCYEPVYFYSVVGEKYIFNIIPITVGDYKPSEELKNEIIKLLPQYYSILSNFGFVEIKITNPIKRIVAPSKPKITAPLPVSAKKKGGKWVCAKKNDKPRKSKQGKGKHMDMQCCLDPDEYPNPNCTY